MTTNFITFCGSCSPRLLGSWKGWPLRDPIPELPRFERGCCSSCGGSGTPLVSADIQWLNYHGQYNTGLPDYWLLVTDQVTVWGSPYFAEGTCPKCHQPAVISQHGDNRSGRFEYKINCAGCGLVRLPPDTSLERTRES